MLQLSALTMEDWAKIGTVFVSIAAIYYSHFYKKVKLNAFFVNSGALKIPDTDQMIHTHTMVLRNNGKLPATNVCVVHDFFPAHFSVNVYPLTEHSSVSLEQGMLLKIERIRPGEEFTLSYLYPSTTIFSHIGHTVKHDDGKTIIFPVKFAKVLSKSYEQLIIYFLLVGLVTTIWLFAKGLITAYNVVNFLKVHQLLS